MKDKTSLTIKDLPALALTGLNKLGRYKLILAILLIAGAYGYVILRISSLSSAEPTANQVSAVQAAGVTHVDKHVIDQLRKLEDNSVSVQALFDQKRNNPFQE